MSPSLWTWGSSSPKLNGFGKMSDDMVKSNLGGGGPNIISSSHCSTVERLYAWEKKLYEEVKVKVVVSTSSFVDSLSSVGLWLSFFKLKRKKLTILFLF